MVRIGMRSDIPVIAKGTAIRSPEGIENGIIELNGIRVEIPAILFAFWCQFEQPCRIAEAKRSFVEAGLPEKLFDLSMDLLLKEGLIVAVVE